MREFIAPSLFFDGGIKMVEFIYMIVQFIIRVACFKAIYNWCIPELFNGFPVLNNIQSFGIILVVNFLLTDKASHITNEDESIYMVFLKSCIRYLLWVAVAFIIKCLFI